MNFHWLRLRATCHPTEDVEKVAEAVRVASGLDPAGFAPLCVRTPLETHHGAPSCLVEAQLKRDRDIRACLDGMLGPVDREVVRASLEERIDDDGVLYLRLDKQRCLRGHRVVGTFDDPVSVRVKVQAHPFSRQRAVAAWQEWLAGRGGPGTL